MESDFKYYLYELQAKKMQEMETVYIGITDDPKRREEEHRQDKDFDVMKIIQEARTEIMIRELEKARLEAYAKMNNGELPKYNKIK